MKRIESVIAIIAVLGLALATESFGQTGMKWRGSRGWGPGSAFDRMYDPKTAETIKGTVVGVDRVAPMKGMGAGLHLAVKTDAETISVHLGPTWYLENQDVKIQPGDAVEVKGSRVTMAGKPALIAAEVKKGDETLRLRDETGVPMWTGWRRG
jgi:hypothetical protein